MSDICECLGDVLAGAPMRIGDDIVLAPMACSCEGEIKLREIGTHGRTIYTARLCEKHLHAHD